MRGPSTADWRPSGAWVDSTFVALIALRLALAALSWIITDEPMAGTDAGPGTEPPEQAKTGPDGRNATVSTSQFSWAA